MQTIEILVAYRNFTWETVCVNLPEEEIATLDNDEIIIKVLSKNRIDGDIALTAIYNIRDA
jgi:hypothetical protein